VADLCKIKGDLNVMDGSDSTTANNVAASAAPSFAANVHLRRLVTSFLLTPAAAYAIYFASMSVVEQKTQSSELMGFMILSSTLPGFLFAMLAGVVVDRHNRVRILVFSNLLRLLVAIGFAAATRRASSLPLLLGAIYASNFCLSALLQFSAAAEDALIPNVVASQQILGANSITQIVRLAGQGLGAALLAPVLLHLSGASLVGVVAIPLLALSTWVCSRLPRQLGDNGAPSAATWASVWNDLRVGWQFIAHHPAVRRAIIYLALVTVFVLVILTLAPGMAARVWEISTAYISYLAVPGGVGFGVASWLLGRHGHKMEEETWIVCGFLALGGGVALLPALRGLRGLYLLLFVALSLMIGAGLALIFVPARAVLQKQSPGDVRGRVIATQLFMNNVVSTLPLPVIGGLADKVGFGPVIVCLALLSLGVGATGLWHTRKGRRGAALPE